MSAQSVWQENAARFATTRESVDALLDVRRREGTRQALDALRAGNRARAHFALQRSFHDQLQIAGLATAGHPVGATASAAVSPVVRLRTGGRHAAVYPTLEES